MTETEAQPPDKNMTQDRECSASLELICLAYFVSETATMSGIFGKFGGASDSRPTLLRMSKALTHRGPDDCGIHVSDSIALACTLLRTRGPSEAGQPAASDNGRILAVIDGAIYSGDTLRTELEGLGREFRMNSDAELIVHLYELEGDDFVTRLRGHFAFAIWDAR